MAYRIIQMLYIHFQSALLMSRQITQQERTGEVFTFLATGRTQLSCDSGLMELIAHTMFG